MQNSQYKFHSKYNAQSLKLKEYYSVLKQVLLHYKLHEHPSHRPQLRTPEFEYMPFSITMKITQ